MASYTVARSKHATLTAATVDTVTIGGNEAVEVLNRSASDTIYFTTDGSTPTVGGDDTFIVGAGQSVVIPGRRVSGEAVKLISSAAADYSVTVV